MQILKKQLKSSFNSSQVIRKKKHHFLKLKPDFLVFVGKFESFYGVYNMQPL